MYLIFPEIITVITAFVVLFYDLFSKSKKQNVMNGIAIFGLGISLVIVTKNLDNTGILFGERFIVDPVRSWFKIIFIISGIVLFLMCNGTPSTDLSDKNSPLKSIAEFNTILLFTISGMMFLISAQDIITLYVCLELSTIPLFALVAWNKFSITSGEAGLKYLIFGALASGLLLYGLGLLYGLSGGTTSIPQMGKELSFSPVYWLAVFLILSGVGFKMTLVPFHWWAADVYEGAPVPVTAWLAVASKTAGLAFLFQLFFGIMRNHISDLSDLMALIAFITMTLGNVVAIIQNNIKRFMAFSGISQAGYLILGFVGVFPESVPSMLFYMLVYVFTNLTVFTVIYVYSNATQQNNITDYRGLSRTNPIMALAMMMALFSLAGIPPLSGFVSKFFLFSIASKAGYHWLVAAAAINSTISLYYYLKIVRQMYIEPVSETTPPVLISRSNSVLLAGTTLGIIILGIWPTIYESIYSQTAHW
ncbi:MAG: NADH-quinone oxidoreductase subunit N [SAR324 cluster bacterium]|nr:NADH-quinone oxidoreductase subunit N [SAR324 cluster bacterium]